MDKQFFHRATYIIAEADTRGYSINWRAIKKENSVCSSIVEGLDMLEEDTFHEWTVRNEDRINPKRLVWESMQERAQIKLWSEVESGARLRGLKMFLQATSKWSSLEFNRVLRMTIFCKPRRDKLWVLARLKSPPTMYRLLERRLELEIIKV